jgi:serine O-acetyltransferase
MLDIFRADVYRYFTKGERSSGVTALQGMWRFLQENTLWIVFLYRIGRWIHFGVRSRWVKIPLKIIYSIVSRPVNFLHDTHISIKAEIGKGFMIGHYGGIWIGPVIIGENCNIGHEVTIGIGGKGEFRGVPTIGNNVYIGPGAKLFGKISIGDNVAIGANAVVSKSIPENAVVVGNPARVVSYEGSRDVLELEDSDNELFR